MSKTTSVGLELVTFGLGVAALVALNLPGGVVVAVNPRRTWLRRFINLRREVAVIAAAAAVLLVVSLVI